MLSHNNNNLNMPATIAATPNAMVSGNTNSSPVDIPKNVMKSASQGDSKT